VRPSGPPHYLAFRTTLVIVVLVALAATVWWLAQPSMVRLILLYLHSGTR
jgi:hypothetical protein